MFKFKYLLAVLSVVMLTGTAFVSCSSSNGDDDDNDQQEATLAAEEGLAAGIAMCDCVSGYEAPNPYDEKYADNPAQIQADFEAYYGELYQCLGVVHVYQEYVTVNPNNYDPDVEDPLLSVFTFTDEDFKEGFKEGVGSCAETFAALFALMPQ